MKLISSEDSASASAALSRRSPRSLEDLKANAFSSDEELDEFPALTANERHRDLS